MSIKSDQKYWQSNGKIISVLDLIGTKIFLFTRSIVVPSLSGDNSKLKSNRSTIQLTTLLMRIRGDQSFGLGRPTCINIRRLTA